LRADREIPLAPGGRFRILVLGDSYTEGLQVDAPFPRLLEERLNAGAGEASRFEVLNAGVSGWSTDNELLYFDEDGWKYRADLVLLVFNTGNDVLENDHALITRMQRLAYPPKPYFELDGGDLVARDSPLPAERPLGRVLQRVRLALQRSSAL